MLRIGVRAHDLGRGKAEFLAETAAAWGASCLQLAPAKALSECPSPPAPMDASWARSVAAALLARGVSVAVLGCYVDLCGPEASSRFASAKMMAHNLSIARDFGTGAVATETPYAGGSLGPGLTNRAALDFLRTALRDLLPLAESQGALLCIEPVWGHAVASARDMADLLESSGSRALGVILDPVNLVDPGSAKAASFEAIEALRLFGPRVAAVHVKDFVLREGAKAGARIGTGLMDWSSVARAAAEAAPNAPFMLEGQDSVGFAAGAAFLSSILGT
jgi:L-ribulose-5-phosphate 3-epimerase